MGERNIRIAVIVVNLFAALSAFAGALGLVVGYMDIPVSELRTTPFADFTVPALLLGFVVGGSALAAGLIALFGPHRVALVEPFRFDALMSGIAGCVMVGWMVIEIAMIGLDTWVQALYLVVGTLIIGLAGALQWAETRETSVSSLITQPE
jgi:hypothetical protein